MRRNLLLVSAAVLAAVSGLVQAQDVKPAEQPSKAWQSGIHRTDLVSEGVDIAQPEVIQARVDFDKGIASPKHSHPGVEVAYVISGTFEYRLEGREPIILKAGESLYIPAGVAHVATNIGQGKASELATYIVKKGEPLLKLEE
ncbi:cupin domain-containing protein [Pseudomonas tolaasii]